jgi:hypothetical protein
METIAWVVLVGLPVWVMVACNVITAVIRTIGKVNLK